MSDSDTNESDEMPDWDNIPVDPYYDPDGLVNPNTKIGLKNGFFISANNVDSFQECLRIEALVIWPRPGNSKFKSEWCAEFCAHWIGSLAQKMDMENWTWKPFENVDPMSVWTTSDDLLLQVTVKDHRLKYIYVIANPNEIWADEGQVHQHVTDAISSLVKISARDVCFIPIEGGPSSQNNDHEATKRNALIMVDVLDEWRNRRGLERMQSAYMLENDTSVFITQATTQRWRNISEI